MGLFSSLLGKKKDNRQNHVFNDSDREFSSEIRSAKKELELLKIERENELHKLKMEKAKLELQQEINELKGVFDEEDSDSNSDSETTALLKILAPMFIKPSTSSSVQNTAQILNTLPPTEQKRFISDDMLLNIWKSTPLVAKQYAKRANDETVLKTIKLQLPDCDEDTYARALRIIRSNPD